jgi:hypothetical protein
MATRSQPRPAALTEDAEPYSFWHSICECLSSIFSYQRTDNTPPNRVIPARQTQADTAARAVETEFSDGDDADDDDSGNSAITILPKVNASDIGVYGFEIDPKANIEFNRLDDKEGFIIVGTIFHGDTSS